ncbi:MAG TPA: glycoside hydrolase family 28 protein [Verrucomicrobiae bacterium]|nr:glycoside hydrolase family 28 protein [Verrucomicrobiae bacterium]
MIREIILNVALLLACTLCRAADPSSGSSATTATNAWNVRGCGAKGDGHTRDTAAVQKALDACASAGGGTVVVPAGNYLIGSIIVGSNTTLKLESRANLSGSPDIDDYPLVRVRWEGEFTEGHRALISSENANHVTITGPGSIFGPPISLSSLRRPRGPVLIELANGTNVVLESFTTQYQQLWSIHLLFCQTLHVQNLTIRSVSSNGDGIDVDSCRDVLIEHCNIDTGDDAIALKSGRGLEAMRMGRPTENVVIKNCTLFSSIFAGLAIGTEMSGGIRNVHIEDCQIAGRQNGIFIKSRDGRGGFIENISGNNVTLDHARTFLAIDLLNKGIQASDPVPGPVEKWARAHSISFSNIRVNGVRNLVTGSNVPLDRPLDGLSISNVMGTCSTGISLANMTNVNLAAIDVTGFKGPLLTTNNVQGSGLDGAVGAKPSTNSD